MVALCPREGVSPLVATSVHRRRYCKQRYTAAIQSKTLALLQLTRIGYGYRRVLPWK